MMAATVPATVFAELVPYRLRWLHQFWAWLRGYFWLPCPLCGRCFGGHEWRVSGGGMPSVRVVGEDGKSRDMGICPACVKTRARQGGSYE